MASNEKCFNYKVIDLFENYNFHRKFVFIWVHMEKLRIFWNEQYRAGAQFTNVIPHGGWNTIPPPTAVSYGGWNFAKFETGNNFWKNKKIYINKKNSASEGKELVCGFEPMLLVMYFSSVASCALHLPFLNSSSRPTCVYHAIINGLASFSLCLNLTHF